MKKSYVSLMAGIVATASLAGGSLVLTSCSDKKDDPKAVEATETPGAVSETEIPSQSPEVTTEPTASPVTETSEPSMTPEVTKEPTAIPEATEEPTATPEATAKPVDYSKLSDRELVSTVVSQITTKYSGKLTESKTIQKMSTEERNIYTISVFSKDAKTTLYSYLKGKNNVTAAYVSEALGAVGANSSKELYDDFIDSMRIAVSSPKKLAAIKKSEYSFDIFDEEYAEYVKTENLDTLLAAYIRNNTTKLKFN
ncbi:MAG: hypothetical protein Q4G58_07095 [bacterium]|nr:hypothetical protein [bacterium]